MANRLAPSQTSIPREMAPVGKSSGLQGPRLCDRRCSHVTPCRPLADVEGSKHTRRHVTMSDSQGISAPILTMSGQQRHRRRGGFRHLTLRLYVFQLETSAATIVLQTP